MARHRNGASFRWRAIGIAAQKKSPLLGGGLMLRHKNGSYRTVNPSKACRLEARREPAVAFRGCR
jgi:hypothetical protein